MSGTFFSETKPSSLKISIIRLITLFLFFLGSASLYGAIDPDSEIQGPPEWWSTFGATNNQPRADGQIALKGQAKHMVYKAWEVFNYQYSALGGAGPDIDAMIASSWFNDDSIDNQLLLIGQLKYMVKPFYDRFKLMGIGTSALTGYNDYPWTDIQSDDSDTAVALLGQLKYVLSFDLLGSPMPVDSDNDGIDDWIEIDCWGDLSSKDETDSDFDGLPDAWEQFYFGEFPLLSIHPLDDPDLDGLTNIEELQNHTSPILSDSDSDGILDSDETESSLTNSLLRSTRSLSSSKGDSSLLGDAVILNRSRSEEVFGIQGKARILKIFNRSYLVYDEDNNIFYVFVDETGDFEFSSPKVVNSPEGVSLSVDGNDYKLTAGWFGTIIEENGVFSLLLFKEGESSWEFNQSINYAPLSWELTNDSLILSVPDNPGPGFTVYLFSREINQSPGQEWVSRGVVDSFTNSFGGGVAISPEYIFVVAGANETETACPLHVYKRSADPAFEKILLENLNIRNSGSPPDYYLDSITIEAFGDLSSNKYFAGDSVVIQYLHEINGEFDMYISAYQFNSTKDSNQETTYDFVSKSYVYELLGNYSDSVAYSCYGGASLYGYGMQNSPTYSTLAEFYVKVSGHPRYSGSPSFSEKLDFWNINATYTANVDIPVNDDLELYPLNETYYTQPDPTDEKDYILCPTEIIDVELGSDAFCLRFSRYMSNPDWSLNSYDLKDVDVLWKRNFNFKIKDTDKDGLSDEWEIKFFGSLNDFGQYHDPDGDYLNNRLEQEYFQNNQYTNLNPTIFDGDPDLDGLDNYLEIEEHGTDPFNKDTDGDGWSDSHEITYGTNPLNGGNIDNTPYFQSEHVSEKENGFEINFQNTTGTEHDLGVEVAISAGHILLPYSKPFKNGKATYVHAIEYDLDGDFLTSSLVKSPDPEIGDGFGKECFILGDTIFISAPYYEGKGVVYIYNYVNFKYKYISSITCENPDVYNFGMNLAADGNRILIGGSNEDTSSVFYLYENNSGDWICDGEFELDEHGVKENANYSTSDNFYDVSGDWVFIGRYRYGEFDSSYENTAGIVHAYKKDIVSGDWVDHKINPPTFENEFFNDDGFGFYLTAADNQLAVVMGNPRDSKRHDDGKYYHYASLIIYSFNETADSWLPVDYFNGLDHNVEKIKMNGSLIRYFSNMPNHVVQGTSLKAYDGFYHSAFNPETETLEWNKAEGSQSYKVPKDVTQKISFDWENNFGVLVKRTYNSYRNKSVYVQLELRNNCIPAQEGTLLDTDDDGIVDLYEVFYFGDLISQEGNDDYDNDGVSNRIELFQGTNPNDIHQNHWSGVYVDASVDLSDFSDGSRYFPFRSIQEAIDASINGGRILIVPGIYKGVGNTNLTIYYKNLIIEGLGDEENPVVIDGERINWISKFADSNSIIKNVSIINPQFNSQESIYGSAIYMIDSTLALENVLVKDILGNMIDGPGIIYGMRSNLTINNCLFDDMGDLSGGSIIMMMDSANNTYYLHCYDTEFNMLDRFGNDDSRSLICTAIDTKIERCKFINSKATCIKSELSNIEQIEVINSIFYNNSSKCVYIGGIGDVGIYNNTLFHNYSSEGLVFIRRDYTDRGIEIINNIFSDNLTVAISSYHPGQDVSIINNCFYNNLYTDVWGIDYGREEDGNIYLDPQLFSVVNNNANLSVKFTNDGDSIQSPCQDSGIDLSAYFLNDFNNNIRDDSGFDIGAIEYSLMGDKTSENLKIVYVSQQYGSDMNDGSAWSQSKRTIQAAINQFDDPNQPGEIRITEGNYIGDLNLNSHNFTLVGGYSGEILINNYDPLHDPKKYKTIIDSKHESICLSVGKDLDENNVCVVNIIGISFINGFSEDESKASALDFFCVSDIKLYDCTFIECKSDILSAFIINLREDSKLLMENCKFIRNEGVLTSLYHFLNIVIEDCEFIGNRNFSIQACFDMGVGNYLSVFNPQPDVVPEILIKDTKFEDNSIYYQLFGISGTKYDAEIGENLRAKIVNCNIANNQLIFTTYGIPALIDCYNSSLSIVNTNFVNNNDFISMVYFNVENSNSVLDLVNIISYNNLYFYYTQYYENIFLPYYNDLNFQFNVTTSFYDGSWTEDIVNQNLLEAPIFNMYDYSLLPDGPGKDLGSSISGVFNSDILGQVRWPELTPLIDVGAYEYRDEDNDYISDHWENYIIECSQKDSDPTNDVNTGDFTSVAGSDDFDGDGILNAQEYLNGTDPTDNLDSDGDGLINYWEDRLFLDRYDPDSDRDGIPDGEEDFDQDELPNFWEILYYGTLDPLSSQDAATNSDSDDLTDLQELLFGLDPTVDDHDSTSDFDDDGITDNVELADPDRNPFIKDDPEVEFSITSPHEW